MIRRDPKKRDGVMKTHVRVVEGYRPGPGMPTKQRTIRSFGYLEDQEDPEAFMAMVEEFNANYKAENVPPEGTTEGTFPFVLIISHWRHRPEVGRHD